MKKIPMLFDYVFDDNNNVIGVSNQINDEKPLFKLRVKDFKYESEDNDEQYEK